MPPFQPSNAPATPAGPSGLVQDVSSTPLNTPIPVVPEQQQDYVDVTYDMGMPPMTVAAQSDVQSLTSSAIRSGPNYAYGSWSPPQPLPLLPLPPPFEPHASSASNFIGHDYTGHNISTEAPMGLNVPIPFQAPSFHRSAPSQTPTPAPRIPTPRIPTPPPRIPTPRISTPPP